MTGVELAQASPADFREILEAECPGGLIVVLTSLVKVYVTMTVSHMYWHLLQTLNTGDSRLVSWDPGQLVVLLKLSN